MDFFFFKILLFKTRQEHRLFKVTVFKGFIFIIVLSFSTPNSSGLNNIVGLFDYMEQMVLLNCPKYFLHLFL